ncbi:hypothetical protein BF95_11575 [Sphingobium sp. Ant17]|nr:hypothetical protein BF95_11575 [Sphingobium sp. Ant17]
MRIDGGPVDGLSEHLGVEQRCMVHADDPAITLMLDMAGRAFGRASMKLRRLLEAEIRSGMAG